MRAKNLSIVLIDSGPLFSLIIPDSIGCRLNETYPCKAIRMDFNHNWHKEDNAGRIALSAERLVNSKRRTDQMTILELFTLYHLRLTACYQLLAASWIFAMLHAPIAFSAVYRRKTLQTLHTLVFLSTDTVGKILTGIVVFTMMTSRSFYFGPKPLCGYNCLTF